MTDEQVGLILINVFIVELEGHKCNIVRDIRTDENGEEYILDEVKLTGGVVEEVRIVPVGNKFTLEGD